MRVGAVVLAAGAGSRFGGDKLLAKLDGRPIVRHVVDAAVAAGLDPIVIVVPPSGAFEGIDLAPAVRVTNPQPQEGLSSSVRIGLRALDDDAGDPVDAAVILPGDQPRVRPAVIAALLAAADERPATPFIVPRYDDDAAPNPILARRSIWRLADEIAGDRGFGPVLAAHPELVADVRVDGANPDVDTVEDLRRLEGVS
ncbi:MAG TPA: nucleotidyltransferase family protein [Candidatus Limnocylindrales bacterium]|jgi:molybdenum cofactor cytidylyltransferase